MTGVSGYKEGVKKIGAGDTIFFRELVFRVKDEFNQILKVLIYKDFLKMMAAGCGTLKKPESLDI